MGRSIFKSYKNPLITAKWRAIPRNQPVTNRRSRTRSKRTRSTLIRKEAMATMMMSAAVNTSPRNTRSLEEALTLMPSW